MSEELAGDPKFPSFTMDYADADTSDLSDITNVPGRRATRGSVYRSDVPAQFARASFSTVGKEPVDTFDDDEQGDADQVQVDKPWDKKLDFESMAAAPVARDDEEEDEDAGFDVPDRLTMGPGAAAARLDLQRCTIRVHKQLVDQIKTNSMKPGTIDSYGSGGETRGAGGEELSRCQGELWLKSRVPMMGWKKRYGSIVDHAYFGPVLFLFKYDAKGNVALHHSMMIVLVDSHVRLGKNSTTKDRDYRCEFVLKTTKRRYLIAANHTMRRDYWLRNLESIQQQASTTYG